MSVQETIIDEQQRPDEEAPPEGLAGLRAVHGNLIPALISRPTAITEGTLHLGSLGTQFYRVLKPIEASFSYEDEEGSFVMRAVEFNEFGYGATLQESITDLQRILIELYEMLSAEDSLGPDLERVFGGLQQKIKPYANQA